MKKRTNAVTGNGEQHPQPPIGDDKARNDGSHRKSDADDAAIDSEQAAGAVFRRKIEQGLVHDGEVEARGDGLNESRRHQGGEIPGHHAKHGASERHDQPEEHDLPQAEAVEREGCEHNDNTRHDGIAEHQQVRLGQAHVVLCRNIVERDVHERLHQRGKQVAREQHHDHRLAVFCGLLVLNSHSGNSILYCGRLKPGAFTRGAPAVDAPPPPATTSEAAAACFVADAFAPTRRKHVALCTKKS